MDKVVAYTPCFCCDRWVAYSLALNNPWIAPANVVGVCAGLFFTMSVLPYANTKVMDY